MSHKLRGDASWVLCIGYPQISGTEGDESVTVKYTASAATLADALPDFGDNFSADDLPGFFSRYTDMTLSERSITTYPSGDLFEVTLKYTWTANVLPANNSSVDVEWEYDTQDVDIPLEQHESYLYKWNHKLLAGQGVSTLPDFYNSATNSLLSDTDAESYKWAKPDEAVPDGWHVIAAETKPGVESFRSGIMTVQMIKRSGNKKSLEKQAALDYTIQTPKETFGRTGIWLRGGSKIRKNGKKWELTVSYLNSKTADTDIYSASN